MVRVPGFHIREGWNYIVRVPGFHIREGWNYICRVQRFHIREGWNYIVRVQGSISGRVGTSVADPVQFFRIRIRVTQKRPDPTGSGSYLDMFLMFSKINIFLWHFLTKSKHLK